MTGGASSRFGRASADQCGQARADQPHQHRDGDDLEAGRPVKPVPDGIEGRRLDARAEGRKFIGGDWGCGIGPRTSGFSCSLSIVSPGLCGNGVTLARWAAGGILNIPSLKIVWA